MYNTNKEKTTDLSVTAEIRIQKHPKSKLIKVIYFIVFIIFFFSGFAVGTKTTHSDGGRVYNRYSELNGTYFPEHVNKRTGWYGLTFKYEGEGWQHNYFYDMGLNDNRQYWGEQKETYSENIALCIIINLLLVTAPFIFEFIRKKECENTELNIKEDRIYGSSGFGLIKKKLDIPFSSVNNIFVAESFSDKIKSGKTLAIIYGNKKARFSYIHNADDVKKYINHCISSFNSKKESVSLNTLTKESSADELKKFKDLLDSGAITQEEFDEKKKQILNL